MKYITSIVGIMFSLILLSTSCYQSDIFPVLKGAYLGQKPPGMKPEIFAPGIISTGFDESNVFFSPDGRELYYYMRGSPHSVILYMKEENGQWTKPAVASFSGKYGGEFSLSPDGKTILIDTNGNLDSGGVPEDVWNIWVMNRNGNGWRKPRKIENLTNTGGYPVIANNGNIYFFDTRKEGMGKQDIYISVFNDGNYGEPVNLGSTVNSEYSDLDPFIAPDESYLIFCSDRPEGVGMYVSFHEKDGTWSKAVNMGNEINAGPKDLCPSVSPDGKYLFFTSTRRLYKQYSESPITYEEKIKILNSPGNGSMDIYWVDAKIIENLKVSK